MQELWLSGQLSTYKILLIFKDTAKWRFQAGYTWLRQMNTAFLITANILNILCGIVVAESVSDNNNNNNNLSLITNRRNVVCSQA